MARLAIIPARGGSKRLPRKNVIEFVGKPIIGWTIEAALKSALFDRVIVTTEDDTIASVAGQFGAEIMHRGPSLASDTAKVVDVCLDVLDAELRNGRQYDQMCCLYATAPLRTDKDIKGTVALLNDPKTQFAMAVCPFDVKPVQALVMDESDCLVGMWPDLLQDLEANAREYWVDNGSTYAVNVPAFRKTKHFYGSGLKGYEMPRSRSSDINTIDDLQHARALFEVAH